MSRALARIAELEELVAYRDARLVTLQEKLDAAERKLAELGHTPPSVRIGALPTKSTPAKDAAKSVPGNVASGHVASGKQGLASSPAALASRAASNPLTRETKPKSEAAASSAEAPLQTVTRRSIPMPADHHASRERALQRSRDAGLSRNFARSEPAPTKVATSSAAATLSAAATPNASVVSEAHVAPVAPAPATAVAPFSAPAAISSAPAAAPVAVAAGVAPTPPVVPSATDASAPSVSRSMPATPTGRESTVAESSAPESIAPESIAPESIAPESIAPESIAPESLRPAELADAASKELGGDASSARKSGELRQIAGIGPRFEAALRKQGITLLSQVAGWSEADIRQVAKALKIPKSRIIKGRWVESAREAIGSGGTSE